MAQEPKVKKIYKRVGNLTKDKPALVDKMIGTSYEHVRTVAHNLDIVAGIGPKIDDIVTVSENMESVKTNADNINVIQNIVESLPILETLPVTIENIRDEFATAEQGAKADTAAQSSLIIETGFGLTGGGDLSEDRTIRLNPIIDYGVL